MESDEKMPEKPAAEEQAAAKSQPKAAEAPTNGPNQTNAGERS